MNITIERIISLLNDKGIMFKSLAEDLGYSKVTVSDWKSGKSESYMKNLNNIASYFDVSIDYLLGNTEIKKKPVINEDDEQFAKLYEIIKDYSPEQLEQVLQYARFLNSSREK